MPLVGKTLSGGGGATDNGNRGGNRIGRDVQKIGGVGIRRLLGGGRRIRSAQRQRQRRRRTAMGTNVFVLFVWWETKKKNNKNERKSKTNSNENWTELESVNLWRKRQRCVENLICFLDPFLSLINRIPYNEVACFKISTLEKRTLDGSNYIVMY
jgi:hypothetical protein